MFCSFRVRGGGSKDSVHNVNIDLDRPIDDRLGVGLVEQVHEDLALLNGDAGVGRDGVAVNEAAIGGSDIQQGTVGDDPCPAPGNPSVL